MALSHVRLRKRTSNISFRIYLICRIVVSELRRKMSTGDYNVICIEKKAHMPMNSHQTLACLLPGTMKTQQNQGLPSKMHTPSPANRLTLGKEVCILSFCCTLAIILCSKINILLEYIVFLNTLCFIIKQSIYYFYILYLQKVQVKTSFSC